MREPLPRPSRDYVPTNYHDRLFRLCYDLWCDGTLSEEQAARRMNEDLVSLRKIFDGLAALAGHADRHHAQAAADLQRRPFTAWGEDHLRALAIESGAQDADGATLAVAVRTAHAALRHERATALPGLLSREELCAMVKRFGEESTTDLEAADANRLLCAIEAVYAAARMTPKEPEPPKAGACGEWLVVKQAVVENPPPHRPCLGYLMIEGFPSFGDHQQAMSFLRATPALPLGWVVMRAPAMAPPELLGESIIPKVAGALAEAVAQRLDAELCKLGGGQP